MVLAGAGYTALVLRQTLCLMLLLLGCGLAAVGVLLAFLWRAAGSADWLDVLAVFGGLGVLAAGLGAAGLRLGQRPRGDASCSRG